MVVMLLEPVFGIQCERISVPACQGLGYNMTAMPNLVGHNSQADAEMVVSIQLEIFLYFCPDFLVCNNRSIT